MRGGYLFKNIEGYSTPSVFPKEQGEFNHQDFTSLNREELTKKLSSLNLHKIISKEKPFYEMENVSNIVVVHAKEVFHRFPEELLLNHINWIEKGLLLLKTLFKGSKYFSALSSDSQENLFDLFDKNNFLPVKLGNKYPWGFNISIAETILKKNISLHSNELDSFLFINSDDLFYLSRSVFTGTPHTRKLIALMGKGFKENQFFNIEIEKPLYPQIEKLIDNEVKVNFYKNSFLTGSPLNINEINNSEDIYAICSIPVSHERDFLAMLTPGTNADSFHNVFLNTITGGEQIIDSRLKGEIRECVSCLACTEVCHRIIHPHYIYHLLRIEDYSEAFNMNGTECTGCGLCSFVCPSKIELSYTIFNAKSKILEESGELTNE